MTEGRRWTLYTVDGTETYQFPINPDDQESPFPNRSVSWSYSPGLGYSGRRSGRSPHRWSFSGVLRDKAMYDALLAWTQKKERVYLTDDRGDLFFVRLLSFKNQQEARPRNRHAPWRHTYSIDALIYEIPALDETFEVSNRLSVGDTNVFERTADAAREGGFGLRMGSDAIDPATGRLIYRQVTAPVTFRSPIKITSWMRTLTGYNSNTDPSPTSVMAICFFVPGDVGKLGYQAVLDIRGGGNLQLRKDYAFGPTLTTVPCPFVVDQWVRLEVEVADGHIEATAYDEDDVILGFTEADDDKYTQGRVGVSAASLADFDNIKVEVPTP